MKASFEMLDETLGSISKEKNLDLMSQLQINFSKWKKEVKQKLENNEKYFTGKLPMAGKLRKENFWYEMNATKVNKKPKLDHTGKRRSWSHNDYEPKRRL